MIDFGSLDIGSKIGTAVVALLGAALGLQKVMTMFKQNKINDIKADTETTMLGTVHTELKRITDELADSRKSQSEMNQMIHQQAIKLTRMEMLLIRMYGLINDNGVEVPSDMQNHIDDLLNVGLVSTTDRRATAPGKNLWPVERRTPPPPSYVDRRSGEVDIYIGDDRRKR